jgi:hypothetical protein
VTTSATKAKFSQVFIGEREVRSDWWPIVL